MNSVTTLAAFLVAAAVPAWTQEKPAGQNVVPPEVRSVLVRWLQCEECTEGELEAVLKLGERAVPVLATTLQNGPSGASLETHRSHLQQTYRQLKAYEKQHPKTSVALSEAEYVRTYLDNYVALIKSRAAIALGRIGGSAARDALEKALDGALRDDVRDLIRRTVAEMK